MPKAFPEHVICIFICFAKSIEHGLGPFSLIALFCLFFTGFAIAPSKNAPNLDFSI
jgi:hypothetical protein